MTHTKSSPPRNCRMTTWCVWDPVASFAILYL